MYTLVAWSESQDSAALINVAALADQHLTVQGDVVRVPGFASNLIGLYALGLNTTRAQLLSPTLRRVLNLEVSPVDRNTLPGSPAPAMFFPGDPIALQEDEDLTAQAAEDAAGAARTTILALLADGAIAPVGGEIFTVRVTAAVTLAAFAWTNGALTFDQTLPPGEYAVVGARFISAGLIGFRFVFAGGFFRPGGIGSDAVGDLPPAGQRHGGWGEWGRFRHTTPPTVDFLSATADASEAGELDLLQVG